MTDTTWNKLNETDKQELSNGYKQGNYRSAYETQEYDPNDPCLDGHTKFHRIGYLLGFYSSYELHEINDPVARVEVRDYRTMYPRFAL